MAASAQLLLTALSKQVPDQLAGQVPGPAFPADLPAAGTPLTSEPPLADATPLTSEPALTDFTPLTSEPTAHRTAGGPESPGA